MNTINVRKIALSRGEKTLSIYMNARHDEVIPYSFNELVAVIE